MAQQINLVNPALYPKQELLTAATILQVAVGFMLLLGVYGGYLNRQVSDLSHQRADWVKRAQDEQIRLVQVTQQYPVLQPSKQLGEELAMMEGKVQQREKVFAVLKSGAVGDSRGFSGLMQAFARQGVNGLWLTSFSFNGAGDQMHINGRALSPDLIPEYIRRFSAEQALRGRLFTALAVRQPRQEPAASAAGGPQKPVAVPQYVEFSLSADKPAKADGAATPLAGKSASAPVAEAKS